MITELHIPDGFEDLRTITMTGLSEIVLLAGANGSGKSRVLKAVRLHGAPDGPGDNPTTRRAALLQERSMLPGTPPSSGPGGPGPGLHPVSKSPRLEFLEQQVSKDPRIVPDASLRIVNIHLSSVGFSDPTGMPVNGLQGAATSVRASLNIQTAIAQGPTAVLGLLSEWAMRLNPDGAVEPATCAQLEADVDRLNDIVEALLGTRFQLPSLTTGPKLFGRPLADARELSAGQRVLLAIAYALFFQSGTEGLTILWDEPELYLHPAAVIDVVERVRRACPGSQLWIATHSIHVLARYEDYGIWFVDQGRVSRGRAESTRVLASLVGNDRRIDEVHQFLTLPAQRIMTRFASECLLEPEPADTPPGDRQTRHIRELIQKRSRNAVPRVLDYGAGKGRLLGELVANTVESGRLFAGVGYYAYNHAQSSEDEQVLKRHFANAGLDLATRYRARRDGSNGEPEQSAHEALADWMGMFDAVVLCNTLHEIPPEAWSDVFGSGGVVTQLLHPEGWLFLVEDYVLAAGERAHEYGFLLLDREELLTLFAVTNPEQIVTEPVEGREDRLKAHLIPRAALARMDGASMTAALRGLQARSLAQVRDIQNGPKDRPHRARLLAVASHQCVNAQLALDGLAAQAPEPVPSAEVRLT